MFTLFMVMLKDDIFSLLKSWFSFLFCSLFSSENPFNIFGGWWWGVFYIFDVPSGEGFSDFRWNPTGGAVGAGGGGVKKTQF